MINEGSIRQELMGHLGSYIAALLSENLVFTCLQLFHFFFKLLSFAHLFLQSAAALVISLITLI